MFSHQEMVEKILNSNDPINVAFSGGKDSIAMVLYLLNLGVPKDRIHLHHHNVDGGGPNLFDWACTESYCKRFAEAFGLKLFFSYRKGGIYRAIYRNNEAKQDVYFQRVPGGEYLIAPSNKKRLNTRMKFPAVSASLITRWCSAEVKIDVMRTVIARNPDYQCNSFLLTGERRQESNNRAKYEEVYIDDHINSKKRFIITWRPIIDWSESQVWDILERYKVQPHPAYMLGWSRCSCQICIFNHPDIWYKINEISPEKVEKIGDTEIDLDFTLYSKKNIWEHVAQGNVGRPMDPYWIEQALGEFTAPLIVDYWQTPSGAYSTECAGSI